MDRVSAKALRAKWAAMRSRRAIAAARDELEGHQRWLEHHCAAWAEDVRLCERSLKRRNLTRAVKRLAWNLFLIAPIACFALLRVLGRVLPRIGTQMVRCAAWLHPACKRIGSHLSSGPLAKFATWSPRRHPLAELGGPLRRAEAASSNSASSPEAGLLRIRLVVASLAAVIVGLLIATSTRMSHKTLDYESATHSATASPQSAMKASNQPKDVERLTPEPILGFALVAPIPAAQTISPAAVTIDEMISRAQPRLSTLEQPEATIGAVEVTLPIRKPGIKTRVKSKRSLSPGRTATVRKQLPWLR